MTYEATLIINGHQPVHIGNYPNKEKAAEAIMLEMFLKILSC